LKNYLAIAQEYFKHLEGFHLYPTLKNYRSWFWIFSTFIWLWLLVKYFPEAPSLHEAKGFTFIVIPEIVWLISTSLITDWKNKKLIESTNLRLGTTFTTTEECRYKMLESLIKVPSTEFFKIAKEIDDLITLEQKFRKRSNITFADIMSNIYDRDSKARLLTLTIALVSIILALVAKSDATIEALFEAYSDPAAIKLFELVALLMGMGFVIFVGLRIMILIIIEGIASWMLKLFGASTISSRWLLSYLIRDLVIYHSRTITLTKSPLIDSDTELVQESKADSVSFEVPATFELPFVKYRQVKLLSIGSNITKHFNAVFSRVKCLVKFSLFKTKNIYISLFKA